jgi:hypothetical protein
MLVAVTSAVLPIIALGLQDLLYHILYVKMHLRFYIRFNLRIIAYFLAGLFSIGPWVVDVRATAYYVDSVGGNDGNSGTATNAAWQSLTNVNATTFQPGDSILFIAGGSWSGTLSPQGSGATNNPITISSYGTSSAMPLINGNGNTCAVALTNQPFWNIDNLEVMNPAAAQAERYGIHLVAEDYGTVNGLCVSNCYVHNICGLVDTDNGDNLAKRTGGITVEVIDDSTAATRFNDICIEDCTISAVTNQGIVACNNRDDTDDFPGLGNWNNRYCSNLIIRNNVISDVCKNAMSVEYGDNTCLVENNTVFNTAIATSGNQIVSYACKGTVFQYNEGYLNKGGNAGRDGSLYDSDEWCIQTVWQYSYSHDEFFGLFVNYMSATGNNPNTNDVVRYNISQNDHGSIFAFTGDADATGSEYIYNNTIYTSANLTPTNVDDRSTGHTTYFYNNIFYNLSTTTRYRLTSGNANTFDYNIFYDPNGKPATEPSDPNELTSNPELVAPGTGTDGLNSVTGYELQSNSPCITNPGLTITTNLTGNPNAGGLDFWGNIVPAGQPPDRGANQSSGTGTVPVVTAESATSVTASNATLSASVNPGGLATSYYFEYGTTTNYGSVTTTNTLAAGNSSITVSNALSGLLPGTLYHYQVVATNSAGPGLGGDATFTTPAPFSIAPNNLYVYQIGNGNLALTSDGAAVLIDQFSTNGTLLGQMALPTNGASAMIASGNSTTEGSLALSPAGSALTFMGYNTNLNTAFPGMNSRPTTGNNRDVALVSSDGLFSIAATNGTAYAPTSGAGRGAVTDGNGNYWTVGVGTGAGLLGNGINYYGNNVSAVNLTTNISPRSIGIYGGNLYFSAGTNIFSIPAATNAATPTKLITDIGGTSEGFIFNTNLTVCYIAEGNASSGGIRRYNLVGGIWTNVYTFSNGVPYGFVAANFNGGGAGTNIIYATTLAVSGGGNVLDEFVDAGAASGATLLATAPANENYNGIVFDSSGEVAPVVSGESASSVTASDATLNASVNPGGLATSYYFEYGTTTNYGSDTVTNTLAAGNSVIAVSNAISGLLPGTLYHYQALATNSVGTGLGGDMTFTTAAVLPPILSVAAAGNGAFQINFSDTPGAGFSVLATTNLLLPLSNWDVIGSVTEIASGQFQFNDPNATNFAQRFYETRSP